MTVTYEAYVGGVRLWTLVEVPEMDVRPSIGLETCPMASLENMLRSHQEVTS